MFEYEFLFHDMGEPFVLYLPRGAIITQLLQIDKPSETSPNQPHPGLLEMSGPLSHNIYQFFFKIKDWKNWKMFPSENDNAFLFKLGNFWKCDELPPPLF